MAPRTGVLYDVQSRTVHRSAQLVKVGDMPGKDDRKLTKRGRRAPGQRAGLTAETILAEARLIIEQKGVEHLTMRTIAGRLGVAPNALYGHFANKSALVEAVLDSLLVEVAFPDLDQVAWRDGLAVLMQSTRRFLLLHADLLPEYLSRPTRGPNAIRLGEATLDLLSRAGLEGEAAADALQILLTYTFGFAAQEAPRLPDPEGDVQKARTQQAFRANSDRPRMSKLAGRLSSYHGDETFEKGLRWLLDGIHTSATGG